MNLSFDELRHAPIALALFASLVSPACGAPDEEEPAMTSTSVDPSAPAPTTTPGPMDTGTPPAATPDPMPAATPPPVMPPPNPTVPDPVATVEPEPTGPVVDPSTPPARCASGAGPSYSTIADIMDMKCTTSCHEPGGFLGGPGGGNADAMLDLKVTAGYEQLTTLKSIQVPDMWLVGTALEDSYLWHKLQDTQAEVGGKGVKMPLSGEPLTAEENMAVEAWITGGACP